MNYFGFIQFGDEIKGFSKYSGIEEGLLISVQYTYELFAACTSVVFNDESKYPNFLRIMDWNLPILRDYTINLQFQKNNKTIFKAISWAGYFGILTGMRNYSFGISLNYRIIDDNKFNNFKNMIMGIY
jgi:acid ceramidase